jgi:hypothetical protein
MEPGGSADGVVRGLPRLLLGSEGVALFGMAATLYWQFGASWILFAVLLLAPDVGMLGYVRGNRVGAVVYDLVRTYLPPTILVVVGILTEHNSCTPWAWSGSLTSGWTGPSDSG